jgi:hypothetical protein
VAYFKRSQVEWRFSQSKSAGAMEGNIMSSVLTRYPGRAIAVSFGLMLFTLTSLRPLLAQAPPGPQGMGSPFSLGVHRDITLVPT